MTVAPTRYALALDLVDDAQRIADYEKAGMIPVGVNKQNDLVEIIEVKDHPWFIGVQFHPEYKSTVASPHPLFVHFVKAAIQYKKVQTK